MNATKPLPTQGTSGLPSNEPLRFLLQNWSRWSWSWLTLLLVQQLVVASSSYWLVSLIRDVQDGTQFQVSLGLVLASLTVPYIPGGLASAASARWRFVVISTYVDRFVAGHRDRPDVWPDRERAGKTTAVLAGDGISTLDGFVDDTQACVSSGLNVALNVAVLVVLIEPGLLLGYLAGLAIAAGLLRLVARQQARFAASAQGANVRFVDSLLDAWDSVTLGNSHNLMCWYGSVQRRIAESNQASIRSTVFDQGTSIVVAIAASVPVFAVLWRSMETHAENHAALAGMVVTIPRLFLVMLYTADLLRVASRWMGREQRARAVLSQLGLPPPTDLSRRVSWSDLRFSSNGISVSILNFGELVALCRSPGLLTIRGANGVGKSSLLLDLKRHFGSGAFLLPARHRLAFAHQRKDLSTGEMLREDLCEVDARIQAEVILLDEWDANLDSENQQAIMEVIALLSARTRVVEVRHRDVGA